MSNPSKEDVLDAFAVEEKHDRDTLVLYLKAYPEFAEDLIDLLSEFRLDKALGPPSAEQVEDVRRDEAWREFIAIKPEGGGA